MTKKRFDRYHPDSDDDTELQYYNDKKKKKRLVDIQRRSQTQWSSNSIKKNLRYEEMEE